MEINKKIFLLSVIFFTYAFFSSSTPDSLSLAEIIIAIGLLTLTGIKGFFVVTGLSFRYPNAIKKDLFLENIIFLYLLYVPLMVGLLHGNKVVDILRDVIPLLYLFLVLFFYPILKQDYRLFINILTIFICAIGVVFSIRHISSIDTFLAIGETINLGDKNYFVMDPAIIFASTFLLTYGISILVLSSKQVAKGSIIFFLGIIAFSSILSTIVRAQIALVGFSLLVTVIILLMKAKLKQLIIVLTVILLFLCVPIKNLIGVYSFCTKKTIKAGVLNNRDAETSATLKAAATTKKNAILGKGWGGLVKSMATNGSYVRFTHCVYTYFILKGGFLGLLAIIAYSILIFRRVCVKNFIFMDMYKICLYLSIFNSLFLNAFLEPGYKMLTIGAIITILYLLKDAINAEKPICLKVY